MGRTHNDYITNRADSISALKTFIGHTLQKLYVQWDFEFGFPGVEYGFGDNEDLKLRLDYISEHLPDFEFRQDNPYSFVALYLQFSNGRILEICEFWKHTLRASSLSELPSRNIVGIRLRRSTESNYPTLEYSSLIDLEETNYISQITGKMLVDVLMPDSGLQGITLDFGDNQLRIDSTTFHSIVARPIEYFTPNSHFPIHTRPIKTED